MFAFASVGSGRWKAERFRSGAYRGTKEVAERQSRLPTESGHIYAFHQSGRTGAESSEPSRSEVSAGRSRNGAPVGPRWFGGCVLERFLFCEAPSEGGICRLPTVFDLELRFCDIQLSSFSAALDAFQYAFRSCESPGMASRHICCNEALPAVCQRMAGRIDQSEFVRDLSRIGSGDAGRCWRFGWDGGDGSGAIPKQGGQGRRK